jgi:LL-diaminopimelate aminotransferase
MIVQLADRLKSVQEYYFSRKLEEIQSMLNSGIDVVNLGIGSPDLVPPAVAIESAKAALQVESSHGYASYRSTPDLRKAMSDWYTRTYQVKLDPAIEVLPLLGSKEGILYLSMVLLNPGDQVLVPNPGYPAYASVANLLNAKIIYYDLKEENGWLPDLEALSKIDLSACKLMWVNYPHMPTGTATTLDFFKKLIAFAKQQKIYLCNDNPYGLVLNETPPLSLLSADPHFEVSGELNSLSKSFNMAGWRVGLFAGAQDVVNAVLQVKSNVDSGMFLPIQKGAASALAVSDEWHQARNATYRTRRNLIYQIFDHLGFTYATDQVGLFVWAKAPDHVVHVESYLNRVLHEAHVFLTPGFIFGSNGERYGRASLCAPAERLKLALQNLKGFQV